MNDLLNVIDENYKKYQLKNLFDKIDNLFNYSGKKTSKIPSKKFYSEWFYSVLTNQEKLKKLIDSFSQLELKILENMIFAGKKYSIDKIGKMTKAKKYYYNYRIERIIEYLHGGLSFFAYNYHDVFLPKEIKNILLEILEIPKKYKLKEYDEPEKKEGYVRFNNEKFILNNITEYIKFLEFSLLFDFDKFYKNFLKKNIKEFKNFCKFNYFFPDIDTDKEINLVLKFLQCYKPLDLDYNNNEPHKLLKSIVLNFFKDESIPANLAFFEKRLIFNYLSFKNSHDFFSFKYYRENLYNILILLCEKKWIQFDNLVKSSYINHINFAPSGFDYYDFEYYTSFKNNFKYDYKLNISEYKNEIINYPIFKMYIYILAQLGMLEIIYSKPQNNKFNQKFKIQYMTLLDDIKYLRITELGKFIVGKQKKYEFKKEDVDTSENIISLSSDILIATVDNNNKLIKIVLKEFGEQIGENSFKFSYEYFFYNAKNYDDIEAKVKRFSDLINKNKNKTKTIPQNWLDFINKIKNRIIKINLDEPMYVLDLPKNENLIRLFAFNPKIKKLGLKVENNKFAIKTNDLNKLKKILNENGFWIEFFQYQSDIIYDW